MLKTRLLPSLTGLLTLLAPHALVAAQSATGEPHGRTDHFLIDDENPESNLPTPAEATARLMDFGTMLAELSSRADAARKRHDAQAALRYDRALVVLTPGAAAALALVCQDYEQLGDRQSALEACGAALNKQDAKLEHYAQFVTLVANRPGGVDEVELDDAMAAIRHLEQTETTRSEGYRLQCELSLRTKNAATLKECASKLLELAPDDARSITFAWSSALREGDSDRARALVEMAKQKQLPSEAIERLEQGLETFAESQPTSSPDSSSVLGWIMVVLALFIPGVALTRKRPGDSHPA